MSIRIAHASDTHDKPSIIRGIADLDADMLLITGDCMNNKGRAWGANIDPRVERKYQQSWFRKQAKKWAADLKGRPVVCVRGNHDFIGYAHWLRHYGATVYEITDNNPMVEVLGIRFAGYRQIPFISGEWAGEERDLTPHIERALACDPTVLVTHGPPAGILDVDTTGGTGYGCGKLTTTLSYQPHNITHHFFGHTHRSGGKVVDEMGIRFINGAGQLIIHEV